MILANTATPFSSVGELRRMEGLPVTRPLDLNSFTIPSFHIIGIESEEFASLFANRKVMYTPGGHGTFLTLIRIMIQRLILYE